MSVTIAKAVEGFNLYMRAEGRSPHAIRAYELTSRRFRGFLITFFCSGDAWYSVANCPFLDF